MELAVKNPEPALNALAIPKALAADVGVSHLRFSQSPPPPPATDSRSMHNYPILAAQARAPVTHFESALIRHQAEEYNRGDDLICVSTSLTGAGPSRCGSILAQARILIKAWLQALSGRDHDHLSQSGRTGGGSLEAQCLKEVVMPRPIIVQVPPWSQNGDRPVSLVSYSSFWVVSLSIVSQLRDISTQLFRSPGLQFYSSVAEFVL